MKFREVNINQFKGYKETKIQVVLKQFVESGIPIAEVLLEDGEYKNVTSAYSAINGAVKRLRLPNVTVRVSNKKLYLINNMLYETAIKDI